MKTFRAIAGYVLGGMMFVVLLPTIMWLASGMPALEHIGALRASITGVLIIGGLTLSVWTIIYMKRIFFIITVFCALQGSDRFRSQVLEAQREYQVRKRK